MGLLELMSTGELISSAGRSVGECTMRFRVLRAVVMENCLRLFLLESGTLGKAAVPGALALGDAPLAWGDQWPLVACRSCWAALLGCKGQQEMGWGFRSYKPSTAPDCSVPLSRVAAEMQAGFRWHYRLSLKSWASAISLICCQQQILGVKFLIKS